jgi:hypothetical protein
MKAQSGRTGKGGSAKKATPRGDYVVKASGDAARRSAKRKTPSGRNGGVGVNRQGSSSASGVYKKKRGR